MILGIYGGVGSGKSLVLDYLRSEYGAMVIGMDETAHDLYEPGKAGWNAAVTLLGKTIIRADGTLDRTEMAQILYGNKVLLERLDMVIHPLVFDRVEELVNEETEKALSEGREPFVVVETALPTRERSDIYSEIWYVYTPKEVRIRRLRESRGYTEERAESIMAKQLPEEEYRKLATHVLNNGGTPAELFGQIDALLSGKVGKKQ